MALAVLLAPSEIGFDVSALLSNDMGLAGQVLQIIVIDLILSGDNAVLIALACRSLPDRRQRRAGIVLGAGVAILLRIVFAGTITKLLLIPYLHLIGGILLLWIAVKLLVGDEDEPEITAHDRLWRAVCTIAIADALMSLDNVIAVAAVAKGSVWLIAFGIALSVPLIIWGSTLVLALIERFPVIIWLGSALLGWIAGELVASETALHETYASIAATLGMSKSILHHLIAAGGVFLTLLLGWVLIRFGRRQVPAD
jgi:YjbE family integral membrane protein